MNEGKKFIEGYIDQVGQLHIFYHDKDGNQKDHVLDAIYNDLNMVTLVDPDKNHVNDDDAWLICLHVLTPDGIVDVAPLGFEFEG